MQPEADLAKWWRSRFREAADDLCEKRPGTGRAVRLQLLTARTDSLDFCFSAHRWRLEHDNDLVPERVAGF